MTDPRLAAQLCDGLLLPLMRGGAVRLAPPVGVARAIELSESLPGAGLFEELSSKKLEIARRLHPVDAIGEISSDEWLLLVALNDLLQLTNPSLSQGFRAEANQAALGRMIGKLIERASAPRTLSEALSRHALFSGVTLLCRRDSEVSWWTGSKRFIGQTPSARLLAWPKLRRVRRRTTRVSFPEMAPSLPSAYDELSSRWLAATPLTLFAALGKPGFSFRWVGSTLAVTQLPLGRSLALRLLLSCPDVPRALAELAHAAGELKRVHAQAAAHADEFVIEAKERWRQLSD